MRCVKTPAEQRGGVSEAHYYFKGIGKYHHKGI